MAKFEGLIRFKAKGDGQIYFASIKPDSPVAEGASVTAFKSLADLEKNHRTGQAIVDKVRYRVHVVGRALC